MPVAARTSQPNERRLPGATSSLYERTTAPASLAQQGCHAGRRGARGIVVLDFGKLASNRGTYGTTTFAGRFASNRSITRGLEAYARGYARCLAAGSAARIVLARGTSNYEPSVPSTYRAGRRWAGETRAFAGWLRNHGLAARVGAAAADDVEPAWDRTFHRTRDFFGGFHSARTGHLLYDYGSLDGGVGVVWTAQQAFYVAGGMRDARAIPEVYNHHMARQWAVLARIGLHRYGRPVRFAGVMTQNRSGCSCGFRPRQAHRALVRALALEARLRIAQLPALTNIRPAS